MKDVVRNVMDNQVNNISQPRTRSLRNYWANHPLLTEFLRDQLPITAAVFIAGIIASYLQHGYLAGGDLPFSIAGVTVPIWHLLWMGFWTGYTMALVGEASGIFSLPYSMSVLQFFQCDYKPRAKDLISRLSLHFQMKTIEREIEDEI